jgi:alkylhydroperoxidase family enzyme
MPYIQLPQGVPGILGPMAFRPETAKPLNELAEILLRGPSSLSRAERELIATSVSARNDCFYARPFTARWPLIISAETRSWF